MSTFNNYKEYIAYNDRYAAFKRKDPKQKRADWQAYLLRQKRKAVNNQVRQGRINRSLIPVPPPLPRAPNRARRQVGLRKVATKTPLSECLLLYAQASIDPFTKLTKPPCIPDEICVPSFKFQAKVETDMHVGTTGLGFVAVCPWAMFNNNLGAIGASINSAVVVTTAASTLGVVTIDSLEAINGNIFGYNSNSPFSSPTADDTPMRVVSAGVEIMYTGQLMDQSGAITVLQWDGLGYVPAGTTVSAVRQNPRASTCANSKDNRCYVSYYPTDPKYLAYKPSTEFLASNTGDHGNNHPLLIVVSGAEPGITFMVRVIAHFETQITNLNATPSESDPIGYPAFMSARSQLLPSSSPAVDLRTVLINTLRNMGKSISGLGGTIGGTIGAALGNPAAGAMVGSAAGELLSSLLGD